MKAIGCIRGTNTRAWKNVRGLIAPVACLCVFAAHADARIASSAPAVCRATARPVKLREPEPLQVLHWWTSAGERKAVDSIAVKMADENLEWHDAAIPGGAGVGAGKVLKSRVLAGNAPDVTQLVGVGISEWADLGLLLELDDVAAAAHWKKQLYPAIWSLIRYRGHVVAAPLGIHRINTLYYNRRVFNRLGMTPPRTWDEFARVAAKLKQAGIIPLAQSSETWQLASLFENLVLAESGPGYYRDLFVRRTPEAFADERLTHALKRLKQLREWMPVPLEERPWTDMARQFADGKAAMFIMGDWVKGELNAWGMETGDDFGCTAAPGTNGYHLYSVDTLAMPVQDYSHQRAQEKMAKIVMSPAAQDDYNRVKGSISVRRTADLSKMDSCARDSARTFARGAAVQAPSLVHRMATDDAAKDAIIMEVRDYFMNDQISAEDAQQRLGAIIRSLPRKSEGL